MISSDPLIGGGVDVQVCNIAGLNQVIDVGVSIDGQDDSIGRVIEDLLDLFGIVDG